MAADDGSAVRGLKNCGEHPESGSFAGAVGSQETVILPGWQVKLTLSTARISPRFLSWKRLDKPRASIIEGPLNGSS